LRYGGAAYLGGSFYGRLRVVLVPWVGCIKELRGLGKHLFHLLEVSVTSYDEFSDLLCGGGLLLNIHRLDAAQM